MTDGQLTTTARTFAILETIGERGRTRPSELSRELEVPLSTVHDHLSTLASLGYLINEGGYYRLGSSLLALGDRTRRNDEFYSTGREFAREMSDEIDGEVSLLVRENEQGVILYSESKNEHVVFDAYPGFTLPLHATAGGKAILATLPEETRRSVLDGLPLGRRTESTITERDELEEELARIRTEGVAFSQGEFENGVKSAAAPVLKQETPVGAICVVALSDQMDRDRFKNRTIDLLRRYSNLIEVNLYDHPIESGVTHS